MASAFQCIIVKRLYPFAFHLQHNLYRGLYHGLYRTLSQTLSPPMKFKYTYSQTIPTPSGFLHRNIPKTKTTHRRSALDKFHYILWHITPLNKTEPETRYIHAHLYHTSIPTPIGYIEAQVLPTQQLLQDTTELYWHCDSINQTLCDLAGHISTSNIHLFDLTDGGNILNLEHIEILPAHRRQNLGESFIQWLLKTSRNQHDCTVAIIQPFPIQFKTTKHFPLPKLTESPKSPALLEPASSLTTTPPDTKNPISKARFTQAKQSITQYYINRFAATPLGKKRAGYYVIDTSFSKSTSLPLPAPFI